MRPSRTFTPNNTKSPDTSSSVIAPPRPPHGPPRFAPRVRVKQDPQPDPDPVPVPKPLESDSYSYSDSELPLLPSLPTPPPVRRCHSPSGFGGRKTFLFYDGDTVLLTGKYADSKVQILGPTNPSQLTAALATKSHQRRFELCGFVSKEHFVCEVSTVHEPFLYKRYFVMNLSIDGQSISLHSKMPHRSATGKFTINFGGKFTQRSIKNSILVDAVNQEMIILRKIGKEDLEIEKRGRYSDLICFGFGILSWLCRC
jgi:hypothetical protein